MSIAEISGSGAACFMPNLCRECRYSDFGRPAGVMSGHRVMYTMIATTFLSTLVCVWRDSFQRNWGLTTHGKPNFFSKQACHTQTRVVCAGLLFFCYIKKPTPIIGLQTVLFPFLKNTVFHEDSVFSKRKKHSLETDDEGDQT